MFYTPLECKTIIRTQYEKTDQKVAEKIEGNRESSWNMEAKFHTAVCSPIRRFGFCLKVNL